MRLHEAILEPASEHFITAAGPLLKQVAVEDVNVSAPVVDGSFGQQVAGGDRDACAPQSQATGDLFVRQRQLVPPDAVVNHQQPTTQAVHQRVARVADGSARDLCDEQAVIVEQNLPYRLALMKEGLKRDDLDLERAPADEHARPLPRSLLAQDGGNPDQSLAPYQGDLDGRSVFHDCLAGNDT